MSKKDIKKFLPPIYKTDEIKNFLDSTTNKLFEPKQSERINYFIGKRSGGVYEHLYDPYAEERTKLRQDYQLEPSLVERDAQTGEVNSVLYYLDLLNNLKTTGAYTEDQNRLFQEEVYSFAPPIDYDMFVNYRDYYWIPEGAPAIEIDAMPNDIVGNINYSGVVKGTDEELRLTTGNHIILNDDVEYIVDGVGNSIRLQEFDLTNNKPLRIERAFFVSSLTQYEKFPKEYITMERGANDENPWSRNNSWYHRDALYPPVSTRPNVRIDRERRALRPIIQFVRDIELFNYVRVTLDSCTVYHDGNVIPTDTVDDVTVYTGMTAIKKNSKKVYVFDGSNWVDDFEPNGKVAIKDGRTKKSMEVIWNNGSWETLQQKTADTQPILFQLYDSLVESEAEPFGNGNTLFGYKEVPTGIFDEELKMTIEHRMSGDSSDFTFENSIRQEAISSDNYNISYKLFNNEIPVIDRLLAFTIGKDINDNTTIFVNDDELPTIIMNSGVPYEFEYSDSSTTALGWLGEYFPITVVDDAGTQLIRPTHGHSKNTRVTFEYNLNAGEVEKVLYYRLETDYSVQGRIVIIPDVEQNDFELHNEFRYKGTQYTTLRQSYEVVEDGDVVIGLEYQPLSDDFTVMVNGEDASDFEFSDREVTIRDLQRGVMVEIFYSTREKIKETNNVIQEPHASLTNNATNDDPLDVSFSDVFTHFGSIIRNQRYLDGTPLGTNTYRDTGKDISLGDYILKHTAPMLPLMFINKNDNLNLIEAIEHSATFYSQYKNNIVLKAEEFQRNNDINVNNTKDVFDDIITDLNAARQASDSFSGSYMFASYKNYISLNLDSDGNVIQPVDLSDIRNIMYIYTRNDGLRLIDHDYRLEHDEINDTFKVVPITFTLDDVDIIRYYDDVEPTFCPATPSKFGIFKPQKPHLVVDTTYQKDVLMLIGHDNSRTLAYTSLRDYNDGKIDGRDRVLLEFENRIYNGINAEFKRDDVNVIVPVRYVPGKFRKIEYTRDEYIALEYEKFFRWSTINMADYTTNVSFMEGNAFTFNYSYNVDNDGEELPGHWKGIFEYYYDTYMPHVSPWHMLGFDIKPEWFDSEYGTDYGSLNTHLWSDLEEGIIRQGERRNVDARGYINNNPYRRVGLQNYIPVDVNGELLSPIDIGITTEPDPQDAKKPWRYGDNAPVEQAWKMMSDYRYHRVAIMYMLKPADIAVKLWNTEITVKDDSLHNVKVNDYKVHREFDNKEVFGITQWIYDLLLGDNLTPNKELVEPFRNIELNLSHKVGGFVNASELRLYSESYNPNSETLSTLVPYEDVNILTHQSKDLHNEVYSGVVVERVEASKAYFAYVDGYAYRKGDIIYNYEDDAYYKKTIDVEYVEWVKGNDYHVGDEIIFEGEVYVCQQRHTSSNALRPGDESYWKLKPFNSGDWAILINPPKMDKTEFRVYGYNVRSPYFPVSIPMKGGKKKSINVTTSQSKPVNANVWAAGQYYLRGHIVTHNDEYYEADVTHTAGNKFDATLWIRWSKTPMVGDVRVSYSTESSGDVDMVEYGQRFKRIENVVEFLSSYGRQLEDRGWIFNDYDQEIGTTKDWEFIIREFVRWSVDHKDIGAAIALSPFSDTANFKPKHGVVSLINQFKKSAFNLLDHRSAIIPVDTTNVTRVNGKFRLESQIPIYFLRLGVREYEHSITVNNETVFGDVNYDPILGTRKDRLRMSGTKSLDWDGTLHAAGYIITDDDMIPNLDTVATELLEINDMDTVATKDVINELKYHNLGYQKRSYLENLEMTDKSQINFYQGFIRQKGTTEAFQRLLRSNVIDANDALDISEEWAFREGVFGSNYNTLQVEFKVPAEGFNFNPQHLNLMYNGNGEKQSFNITNIDIENFDEWVMKPERYREDGSLWKTIEPKQHFKTAGYVQYQEHELKSPTMKRLNTIMNDGGFNVQQGLTAWIGYNEIQHGSWDVLLLDTDNEFIGEIYNHGNDGENSAVVKAYNVNEDDMYIVTHPDGYYNITFRYIKDGYYIMLSHDEDEYVVFNPALEYMDLSVHVWKPLRVMFNDVDENIDNIEQHIERYNITPTTDMLLYHDGGFNESWTVNQYDGMQWNVIRTPRNVVDISLFNDVVAYDENDVIMDYVKPYDPIQGFIPNSLLSLVDIISDNDPVTYTDREFSQSRYSQMEGTLWLDSKDLIYIDYHQGDNDYRKTHWGSLFPYTDVSVYEWTKADVMPVDYDGEVYSNSSYITQQVFNDNIGMYKTYYYFWVKNPVNVNDAVERTISANDISQSIKYPYNNGNPLLAVIDNYSVSIMDSSRRLIMNDITLRINYQYQHTSVPVHTQWQLIDESKENDEIPKFVFDKMIDSIIGYDDNLNPIPDPNLPETSRYGVNRGQSWFIDIDAARKVFFEKINDFITKLNIWDIELFWERLYGGIDSSSKLINFEDWYDEDFDPDVVITNLVNSRIEVTLIPMEDGDYVKVIEPPATKPSMRDGGWTIYEYIEEDDTFKKLGQSGGTLRFNIETILSDGIDVSEIDNIRNILNIMFEYFAVRPYHEVINDVLFSMVRLVMAEQPNNNWLFPSTYIKARQELVNLVPSLMYRVDKEQQIRNYIREAKPFHTKLREFKKVNKPKDEYVPLKVTDFDKPPHVDEYKNFFILQERNIDTVTPDYDAGKTRFELEFGHEENVRVTINERFVQPDKYEFDGRFIVFDEPPMKDKNLVPSIVVESDNIIHRSIIHEWNPTYGYRILDNTRDLDVWGELAINKHIQIHYDRNAHNNLVSLEKIVELYDYAFEELDEPYAYLDSLSEFGVDESEWLREMDRIIIYWYVEDARTIIDNSFHKHVTGTEDYFYEIGEIVEDELVLINDKIINRNMYDVIQETTETIIRFKFEPLVDDHIVIRPRSQYLSLMKKVGHYKGLNVANEPPTYIPEGSDYCVVDVDNHHPMVIEHDGLIDINDEIDVFSHGDDNDPVISGGTFGNDGKGYPEEKSELHIHETMVFMSLNHMPPLVKMGYDTLANKTIQPTYSFDIQTSVYEYNATIIVPSEQVKVIVNNDVMIQNIDYTVLSNGIRMLRDYPDGSSLIITDLYSNFDPNYHNSVKRIKNINGGFDSFVFDYSRITEMPVTREFIAYNKMGNVFYMKANDEAYFSVTSKPDYDSVEIPLSGTLNDMYNRVFAIVGFNLDPASEQVNSEFEIVRGSIIDNTLTRMTRGLFVGENYTFTDKEYVRVYELHVEDGLENYVIQESIVGITGKQSYPKYGNIFN